MMDKMVRLVTLADAAAIAEIYNYYIVNTTVSFEESPVSTEEMKARIEKVRADFPWLVYEENGIVLGYAYLSKWKERISYRHTAEVSIYLKHGSEGRGIGTILLEQLLEENKNSDIHVLVACIALPHPASIALHEKFGFKKVAHYHEVGFKKNRLLDVGDWELVLG
ncbi:MAG: GNAT family N-acetyltransferase [Spirochaetaceae bacterium]|jgi:phosphinothricin acetyltransferase|nr:GNAT family N-acetyltransferase [Spirochaetaceae bacterium]